MKTVLPCLVSRRRMSRRLWFHTVGLVALVCLLGGGTPLQAKGEAFWYPFARAFGGPKESDLAKYREAFRALQAGLPTGAVGVAPVLVMSNGADVPDNLAVRLARQLSADTNVSFHPAPAAPTPAKPAMGHNQMRYAWDRATQYADAVRAKAKPGDEPVLFVEVWTANGKVNALHLFLITGDGQLAYCRWYNSHHFGSQFSFENLDWLGFTARQLQRDLKRTPEEIFPKYGVG